MPAILAYTTLIYDAQLIVYYCFKSEHFQNGTPVVIDSPPYTDLTRNLTQFFLQKGKTIKTIGVIFDEINKTRTAKIVKERLNDADLRTKLGLKRGERVNAMLELKLNRKITKKIAKLQYERWFKVDYSYNPDSKLLSAIVNFFKPIKLAGDIGYKISHQDCCLIAYPKETTLPVISNDRDIYYYRNDLERLGLTHKIAPFPECTEENLNASRI